MVAHRSTVHIRVTTLVTSLVAWLVLAVEAVMMAMRSVMEIVVLAVIISSMISPISAVSVPRSTFLSIAAAKAAGTVGHRVAEALGELVFLERFGYVTADAWLDNWWSSAIVAARSLTFDPLFDGR